MHRLARAVAVIGGMVMTTTCMLRPLLRLPVLSHPPSYFPALSQPLRI